MQVVKVRLGQEVRDLMGKNSEGQFLSAELRSRAAEMKAGLSAPAQAFVKNILGQKTV